MMLHLRSQTLKATYYMIQFIQNVQNRTIDRDRKYRGGCQGLEGVGAGLLLGGQDGHDLVQKSDCGDGCKALGID